MYIFSMNTNIIVSIYVLIQNVVLKELIKMMATTITDIDIELKMKNNIMKYLESKKLTNSYKCLVTICIQNLVMLIHELF